jgi:hypothetical protein
MILQPQTKGVRCYIVVIADPKIAGQRIVLVSVIQHAVSSKTQEWQVAAKSDTRELGIP